MKFKSTLSIAAIFVLTLGAAVLRGGYGHYPFFRSILRQARTLPALNDNYTGESIWVSALARMTGALEPESFIVLSQVVVCLSILLISFLPAFKVSYVATALIACSVAVSSNLVLIGHYDNHLFLFLVIFLIGLLCDGRARIALLLVASSGLALVNGGQAIFSLVSLLIVLYGMDAAPERQDRKAVAYALVWLTFVLLVWLTLRASLIDPAAVGRVEIHVMNLSRALRGFSEIPWVHMFSWYSALWIFVLYFVSRGADKWQVALRFGGLVLLPGVLATVTGDGTRVFSHVSFLALAVAAIHESDSLEKRFRPRTFALLGLLVLFVPMKHTWIDGVVRDTFKIPRETVERVVVELEEKRWW